MSFIPLFMLSAFLDRGTVVEKRRVDSTRAVLRLPHEEDDDADDAMKTVTGRRRKARIAPEVGDFAIVFPKLLVALFGLAADASAASTAF